MDAFAKKYGYSGLEFTPLEFETYENKKTGELKNIRIYSVGV